ncbi:thiamine-phosphate kinase [Candidatus Pelagibacter sp.]|nr:thiamine-phosphate kinase [Candidatus Pelagibacter sp.]
MNEFNIIKDYFSILSNKNSSSLNLNDDVFFNKKKNLLISVDTYIEGVHFLNFKKPDLVIKKIIRSSISDIICKGGSPKYYFISASGNKKNFTKSNLSKIMKSINTEQKKYKIFLSGGDTVFSNKLSFTITSVGFAKNIIYRNKAKINDDIYVTGNLGNSYLGLLCLKNKIKITSILKKYFINHYYKPDIKFKLFDKLKLFANTSIDISDGLFADLDKMINIQNLSYKIKLSDVPISMNLYEVLKNKELLKINYISKGDDYQILFTATESKRRVIKEISSKLNLKITKIGKILNKTEKKSIVDVNNQVINVKNKGYFHKF